MTKNLLPSGILLLSLLPGMLLGQSNNIELSLEQSLSMLRQGNQSIMIAEKGVELARSEHQRINSFWFPSVNISGAYAHMSNDIEVREPLSQFTDPAKEFVHSIIPDDQIISGILDQIGTHSLTFPLATQNIATVDANVTWPVFAGGKRIYAGRIAKTAVSVAETNKELVDAQMQTLLVESYYGIRLGERVLDVRTQAYNSLEMQYRDAMKLEAVGMIDKAERLFVQVSLDEARRELETAGNDLGVAKNAFKTLIKLDSTAGIRTTTPLFINDTTPPVSYFRSLAEGDNYIITQLGMQGDIVANQLRMDRTGYSPEIAFFGKQTLYSHGLQKNLLPRTIFGVGLTWNLFDGLAREKKIGQSRITQQTIALTREKAQDDIAVGIDKLYAQLSNSLSQIAALNTTIELSRELLRMRRKAFTEGMATSTEVVDAEVMLSKVQIAMLLAYYQYDVALINLLSLCGHPELFTQYSATGKTEHFIFTR